jgi:inorganic pyrophosphatase
MNTAMFYPCNYGFVPHTLSDDGDPVDVLVVTPVPLMPGVVIACRPVGMLQMTDEAGEDAKVLAVPVTKLHSQYESVQSATDLPQELLNQIAHFFEHYKDLEPNKWVKIDEWVGPDQAKAEINASVKRYQDQ